MPDVRTHAARSLRAVDVRFADFSEFASSGGWSLDFDKLDRGCSRGSIMQVADGAQVRKLPTSLEGISKCAVERRRSSVGVSPTRQLVAPAGSNRSGRGGNETTEAFDAKAALGGPRARRPNRE